MAKSWFQQQEIDNNFGIKRTDYIFTQNIETFDDIPVAFLDAIVNYIKTQRLLPNEIEQLSQLLQEAKKPEGKFRQKLLLAFAEGLLTEDFQPLDDDDYLGTFGETFFKWIRESFLGDKVLYCAPEFATGSSTTQGVDYFEIVGDKNDLDSLYFVFWEIKGTDREVKSRSNEIYQQHKKRTGRLLRGLQRKLPDQYERENEPILRQFTSYLMDYWVNNGPQKRLGGCVVYSIENQPGRVFTTFSKQLPDLADKSCRPVCLIAIPHFSQVRAKVLELICEMIGLTL